MSDWECPKCKTEYEATGSHEDDVGEYICDDCGFKFIVDIEYDPSYEANCAECEYGEYEKRTTARGTGEFRFCRHCGNCQMKRETNG